MLHTIFKKMNSLKPSLILSVVFLLFIFYVGLAAFPQFLANTKDAFLSGSSLREYIRSIDDQYHGVLTASSENSLLQDKGTYINLNGLMANALRQPFMNERVKLSNGHLTSVVTTVPQIEAIEKTADNIGQLYQKQAEKNKHFLFVLVPSQVSKYEDLLPAGYTDTTNETADILLQFLDEAGVPYLDLRESMIEDGIAHEDAYFTTDHHWKPQTGFWAYTKILEKLEQLGAISPVDDFYTTAENYKFQTYEDSFLGSSGKRTGIYYAGLDDSVFIVPQFETEISIKIENRGLDLKGTYENICYNTDVSVDFSDIDYFSYNAYGLYGWGDTPLTEWRNENAPENTKFMLIGESFGNVPYSLMPICISSCDELDMRYYSGDFAAYYEDYDPDTVILEVNVDQAVAENTSYPFFPEAAQ